MKPSNDEKHIDLELDYLQFMKDYQNQNLPIKSTPEWSNPGDFIVKFSLYKETPESITSTDTKVNLEV